MDKLDVINAELERLHNANHTLLEYAGQEDLDADFYALLSDQVNFIRIRISVLHDILAVAEDVCTEPSETSPDCEYENALD